MCKAKGRCASPRLHSICEYGRNGSSFAYPAGRDRSPNLAVRDGPWKLLIQADGSNAELYDLAADPSESRNLAGDNPDVTRRLSEAALAWRRSLPGTRSRPAAAP